MIVVLSDTATSLSASSPIINHLPLCLCQLSPATTRCSTRLRSIAPATTDRIRPSTRLLGRSSTLHPNHALFGCSLAPSHPASVGPPARLQLNLFLSFLSFFILSCPIDRLVLLRARCELLDGCSLLVIIVALLIPFIRPDNNNHHHTTTTQPPPLPLPPSPPVPPSSSMLDAVVLLPPSSHS